MLIHTLPVTAPKESPLYGLAIPANLEEVLMQMEILATEPDEAIAHKEADRLLLQIVSGVDSSEHRWGTQIANMFQRIAKYYE